jgi:hypothetical protein
VWKKFRKDWRSFLFYTVARKPEKSTHLLKAEVTGTTVLIFRA